MNARFWWELLGVAAVVIPLLIGGALIDVAAMFRRRS